jgi:hypothetical protein
MCRRACYDLNSNPAHRSKAGPVPFRGSGAYAPQQLIDGDRQIANALSGGVIDRIGDRRGGSDDSDLADAFDPEWIDLVVCLIDEDQFYDS